MTRFLKRTFLTAFFALFAVQASAMFIQPDWFDPTQPGVGTNRYSYSGNDPINRLDPSGNAFFDWFDSQERSDERNQEAADSYSSYVDHLTSQDPLENPHAEFQRQQHIAANRAAAEWYQQRVGLSREIRMRYDLGLSVRKLAGASVAAVAPPAGRATIANTARIHPSAIPNAQNAIIDPRKISEYVLNPAHPVGGNKARVFESALGINRTNSDILTTQIMAGVRSQAAVERAATQHGRSFRVDIPVRGPNGTANVRTNWQIDHGTDVPRFISGWVD